AVGWLYQNLHNPYPSPQVRESIATKSKSPRKDVDNWFVDARRRIGND
nr:a 1-2 protein - inky cap (Coprinus cinereus) [Coprinopsis cinerea]